MRHLLAPLVVHLLRFQSTHPRRVRPSFDRLPKGNECFNPRTHVGCDSVGVKDNEYFCEFQSTHPRRVRRQCAEMLSSLQLFQSTHPRRVRRYDAVSIFYGNEFQSTHPRRVRRKNLLVLFGYFCFNPRTHVGCDSTSSRWKTKLSGFNPRTHVGCDTLQSSDLKLNELFQSTHPRRVRLDIMIKAKADLKFQSTHPRRVRPHCHDGRSRHSSVSIHAPT